MAKSSRHASPTMDLLLGRASCRNYSDREIPPDVLSRVLEAGIHAPTAGNLQPYSIIKVKKKRTKEILAELCGGQNFVMRAPLNLVFCIDWHRLQRWAEFEIAPWGLLRLVVPF